MDPMDSIQVVLAVPWVQMLQTVSLHPCPGTWLGFKLPLRAPLHCGSSSLCCPICGPGWFCPVPQHFREVTAFSHCGLCSDLPLNPGVLPSSPDVGTGQPALLQRNSHRDEISLCPSQRFSSCLDTVFCFHSCSFSSLCLSAEGIPSLPFLCTPFYFPQFAITHL